MKVAVIVRNHEESTVDRRNYLRTLLLNLDTGGPLEVVTGEAGFARDTGELDQSFIGADVVMYHCGRTNTEFSDFVAEYTVVCPSAPLVLFSGGDLSAAHGMELEFASVCVVEQEVMEANIGAFLRFWRNRGPQAKIREGCTILQGASTGLEAVLQFLNGAVGICFALGDTASDAETRAKAIDTLTATRERMPERDFENAVMRAGLLLAAGGDLADASAADELDRFAKETSQLDAVLSRSDAGGRDRWSPLTDAPTPSSVWGMLSALLPPATLPARFSLLAKARARLLHHVVP